MNVAVWKMTAVQVLGFACLGLGLGIWLKSRFRILDRLNIPASIVGGLLFSLVALAMRDRVVNLEPDLVLRDILNALDPAHAQAVTCGIGLTYFQ